MSNWNSETAPVVVYGATGPLGEACIRHFTAAGRRVAAIARDRQKLQRLEAQTKAAVFSADMANAVQRDAAREFIARFLENEGSAVFLLAMGSHHDTLPGCGEERIQEQIRTNLEFPLQEALYWAHRLPGGHFIFFADAAVQTPAKGYHAYRAAKSGVISITRSLALDLAPAFRVNAVAPGIMNLKPHARPDALQRWSARVPLGRIGAPDDIARAVAFLVEHEYLTGVILPVDGGLSLGIPAR